MMLETTLHTHNAFVTLTYSDQKLPKTSTNLATLEPKHLSDWLKRLRKAIEPSKIRYFAVGEYGDETHRPHYHIALFGYPNCARGNTRDARYGACCAHCELISTTWGKGQVFLGDLSVNSAQYITGYVSKKLTDKTDITLLGRHPEFARMSLKPGIGADFMHEVASTVLEFNIVELQGDVPSSLKHGSRNLPLGNYLTRKLRKLVGQDEKAPQSTINKVKEALQPMRETAFENSRSFKQEVIDANSQKVLNAETKRKIFKQKRKL